METTTKTIIKHIDKIPIQMLQKLYRHSDITTTINYQQSFINKDTDDALEAVIGGDK